VTKGRSPRYGATMTGAERMRLHRPKVKILRECEERVARGHAGGLDVFIHAKNLPRGLHDLALGEPVEFDEAEGKGGRPKATNIKVLEAR
jgi:cold shock CspA family protein